MEPLPQQLRKPKALSLSTMVRIEHPRLVDQLIESSGIKAHELLANCGLGLYQSTLNGLLMVGLTAPDIHYHERWMFFKKGSESSWHAIHTDTRWHYQFSGGLATLLGSQQFLALQAVRATGARPQSALLAQRLSSGVYNELVLGVDASYHTQLSTRDRHDLLHHYEIWLSRNPDYAGMPRDIVRRTHGLGLMVDAQPLFHEPLDAPDQVWQGIYGVALADS